MRAVYLQSVRSPVVRNLTRHHPMSTCHNVCSQSSDDDDDDYVEDSFCVNNADTDTQGILVH